MDDEEGAPDVADASGDGESGDGWSTVPSRKRSGGAAGRRTGSSGGAERGGAERSGAERGGSGGGINATKTIQKRNQNQSPIKRMPRSLSSEGMMEDAEAAPPAVQKLVGVPMTRSRSERSRLLAIGEAAVAAESAISETDVQSRARAELEELLPPLPLTRSAASQTAIDLNVSGVPLTRSAASQLALDISSGMNF